MDILTKWKKAVVHLECVTDSVDTIELHEKYSRGEMTREQFIESLATGTRDVRYGGTAIFLKNDGKRYLLTARHVLFDEQAAKRDIELYKRRNLGPDVTNNIDKTIFKIIFRIPLLDEYYKTHAESKSRMPELLMNLGAGSYSSACYTFSRIDDDLAIVSLDAWNSKFADELEENGYVPVNVEDIGTEPKREGDDIIAVGYPTTTSIIGKRTDISRPVKKWMSEFVSNPVICFGKVAMMHSMLNWFWGDISAYPGNSGCPVISDDGKLIGIASEAASIANRTDPSKQDLIPFAKAIKASLIFPLLEEQKKKDRLK